jgi:hypothetical protein
MKSGDAFELGFKRKDTVSKGVLGTSIDFFTCIYVSKILDPQR